MGESRDWCWTLTASPSGDSRRRISRVRVVTIAVAAGMFLLVAGLAFAGSQAPTSGQVPQTVEADPVPQQPPVNELGLVVVDEFGTTVKADEPYRAPAARPAVVPGPGGNWQVVLYNSRLILLEGSQTGQWSRGVTHKRV